MRAALLTAVCCVGAAAAAEGVPGLGEEDQQPWTEAQVALPTYPAGAGLIEFTLDRPTSNRFYLDSRSLSAVNDDVVRFTAVVDAQGGARSIAYEGIRCATRERRLYAVGRADGTWAIVRDSMWRSIELTGPNRYHALLYRQFLCPNRRPIQTAEEGVAALKQGSHPDVRFEHGNR